MTTKGSRGTAGKKSAMAPGRSEFDEVLTLIEVARQRAYQAVNTELVGLYWELGEYICHKLESAQWGDGVVDELAAAISRQYPGMRGYTRRNLFRMRQFFEAYRDREKVSPLVTQLPWTHHLLILSATRHPEEREFYILAAIQGRWTKRELERQIRSGGALRAAPSRKKVSPAVAQIHPTAAVEFKNEYSLEFLGLPDDHSKELLRKKLHELFWRRSSGLAKIRFTSRRRGARGPVTAHRLERYKKA